MADTNGASSSKGKEIENNVEDFEKILSREAAAFQRDLEVDRILKAFKLNPYDVLDLDFDASDADIKKKYRQLSLFIHPDKTPHPRAPDAFDLLKKAESELSDKEKRLDIDSTILFARTEVLKSHSIPTSTPDSDPRIAYLKPSLKEQVRIKTKELLIDEELRRRRAFKLNLANEGLEAKRKEEEVAVKKRKAEEDARWEDNRDKRVEGWRSFQSAPRKRRRKGRKFWAETSSSNFAAVEAAAGGKISMLTHLYMASVYMYIGNTAIEGIVWYI
ncbi:hypothetical protein BS47DRAFT_1333612 [Hydnum rufescens UP504]|uniref:J domain-containing protein n=1 Tax=Hydnum rufescens UP504 TaxID=1448309 RepID=A0A9P6AJH5_9AGAM|nr:hypothetical protein BS47DRAFT_1333612 [Hydnum rufescens UP504]